MLKGVHREIIEIRQTDHPYFERAVLFVRTDCVPYNKDGLQAISEAYLKEACAYTGLRRNRLVSRLVQVALVLCGGIGGMLISMFVGYFR